MPTITLHGPCHRGASISLPVRADVKVMSDELGRATMHFIQDTYPSVFQDAAQAVVEAASMLLRGGAPVSWRVGD